MVSRGEAIAYVLVLHTRGGGNRTRAYQWNKEDVMTHDLKIMIERFEKKTGHAVGSWRPGKRRLYSVMTEDGRKLSPSLTSNEMEAWLDGWLTNEEEHRRAGLGR